VDKPTLSGAAGEKLKNTRMGVSNNQDLHPFLAEKHSDGDCLKAQLGACDTSEAAGPPKRPRDSH